MAVKTQAQHELQMRNPAFAELLPVRDFLDGVMVRTSGAFVAGYQLGGIHSLYASDDDRRQVKGLLEALLRSVPEVAMRLQVRFEILEGLGDLLARYNQSQCNPNPNVQAVDRVRVEQWTYKEEGGAYVRHLLHAYVIWDPRLAPAPEADSWRQRWWKSGWGLSTDKCFVRTQKEHQAYLSEFNSLMAGVESSLEATGIQSRRLSSDDMFLELKRALSPLADDGRFFRHLKQSLAVESARSQAANVSIEEEGDDFLKINGLLYSILSLKELPDATFPGLLRELMIQDFPLVANAEFTVPDQAKVIRTYKSRLRKMQAAQRDINNVYLFNPDAHVAEHQLMRVLEDVVSSSLKTCQASLQIAVRTSAPAHTNREYEEARHILAERRQRVLHATGRMAGARAMTETLAKRRIFIGSLPGLAERNQREHDCLTLNGADLMPVELPWFGMPASPLMLVETPFQQLIPFSVFDPSLPDANVLIMAGSGGGKTFLAQQFLLMAARSNPQICIIERGDSYQALVELMGGRVIEMTLDSAETINPWDLETSQAEPTREKVAFLKNLTRYMIGDHPGAESELIDQILSEAIVATYRRRSSRPSNPIPTFTDLVQTLSTWTGREKM